MRCKNKSAVEGIRCNREVTNPELQFCTGLCQYSESDGFQTVHSTNPVDAEFVPVSDPISPNHYIGKAGLEVRDVIAAFELGFNLGNVVKYVLRAGKKNPEKRREDLQKARKYIDFELEAK